MTGLSNISNRTNVHSGVNARVLRQHSQTGSRARILLYTCHQTKINRLTDIALLSKAERLPVVIRLTTKTVMGRVC